MGPDNITPVFKKNCSSVLVKPLSYLFNRLLSSGCFPSFWKRSFVIPLHKTGNISEVNNYRPISKMSTIPKLFKALITVKLSALMKNCLSNCQHGFRSKHSIVTNNLLF